MNNFTERFEWLDKVFDISMPSCTCIHVSVGSYVHDLFQTKCKANPLLMAGVISTCLREERRIISTASIQEQVSLFDSLTSPGKSLVFPTYPFYIFFLETPGKTEAVKGRVKTNCIRTVSVCVWGGVSAYVCVVYFTSSSS